MQVRRLPGHLDLLAHMEALGAVGTGRDRNLVFGRLIGRQVIGEAPVEFQY